MNAIFDFLSPPAIIHQLYITCLTLICTLFIPASMFCRDTGGPHTKTGLELFFLVIIFVAESSKVVFETSLCKDMLLRMDHVAQNPTKFWFASLILDQKKMRNTNTCMMCNSNPAKGSLDEEQVQRSFYLMGSRASHQMGIVVTFIPLLAA